MTHTFHFHAYQTIRTAATVFENATSERVSHPRLKVSPKSRMPKAAQTMPTMMFAQRFAESFRVRDRKAMVKGISQKIAKKNNNKILYKYQAR